MLLLLVLLIISCVAIVEALMAIACWIEVPGTRWLAPLLLIASPLQVLWGLLGIPFLTGIHTPSSFDPVADGFDLLEEWLAIELILVLAPIFLGTYIILQRLYPPPKSPSRLKKQTVDRLSPQQ